MTTLERDRSLEDIIATLSAVRMRRWTVRLLTGVLAVATILAGAMLVIAAAAGYWEGGAPAALRVVLLVGGLAAVFGATAWCVIRALFHRMNTAQTARFIEENLPEARNDLINSVLLANDRQQSSQVLVAQAIRESAARLKDIDVEASVSTRPLHRWALAFGVCAVLVLAFGVAQPTAFVGGLGAVLAPDSGGGLLSDLAGDGSIGEVEMVELLPGDVVMYPGEPLVVTATLRNEPIARIARRHAGDAASAEKALSGHAERMNAKVVIDGSPLPMASAGFVAEAARATFTRKITGRAEDTIRYAVEIGGNRWPRETGRRYTAHVLSSVGMDAEFRPPKYTGIEESVAADLSETDRSFELPLGTEVALTVRLSAAMRDRPAPAVLLCLDGQAPAPARPARDGRTYSVGFTVTGNTRYRIEVHDTEGNVRLSAPSSGEGYAVRAVPDRSPKVKFLLPNRDVSVAPGGTLATRVRFDDDYGLTEATLLAGREGEDPKPLHRYAVTGKPSQQHDYTIQLPDEYAQGDVVVYHAVAMDNRELPGIGGPRAGRSSSFKILVQDPEQLAKEKALRYERLRQLLLHILKLQEVERVNTEICRARHDTVEKIVDTARGIAARQEQIRAALHKVAYEFPFDADLVSIQQATALLAANEAPLAVEQAKVLAALPDLAGRERACAVLAGTQDRIIDVLQTLLAVMPTLTRKDKAPEAPGGDLPPETQAKLAELKKKLEEFIDAQKKVIEASKRLAKKPVDAFTAEDEKLLQELKAVQDKWEKFLNEAVTDFSKLAQQDFSNPALLKELMAVKSDVTMAKDALKKKATEIATAIEDNGIENAESLTTNLEKWLPDEPDRIKWAMEDPAGGQENIEQPELPTELEDLVGDLLEQEEDLFEEMDDITGKYNISGDKGIGWDAMDGPISNMNAQGVTGNQLPNTNEMSGRSGEGRQGKSSGEFVEDKAVGKGGRRTPTRLTPEPFQKGQVNDMSKDPPGGATGGGKFSGAGEEGLEGPVPPPLAKELQRMAPKQAALINRAERLQARFEVKDYANFKFLETITLMNRVKSDLESYRYRNVLRSRDEVVGSLRETHDLLTGDLEVTADETRSMPKYLREDIADAARGRMPERFREALEAYYRRLGRASGN